MTTATTLSPRTVMALRRMCTDITGSPTYAPNKYVHDGLFEVSYYEGMEDDLLAFLITAEDLMGMQFAYEVKSTRVRVGLAGTYL